MGSDKGFVEWEHEFCALVVEVSGNESQYFVGCCTAFFGLFLPLESLVIVIPKSRCSSVAVCCWFAIVQLCWMLL